MSIGQPFLGRAASGPRLTGEVLLRRRERLFVGPVFTREVVTAPRRDRLFWLRGVYVAALGVLMAVCWQVLNGTQPVRSLSDYSRFGAEVAGWFDRYRDRSLRAAFERLVERAAGGDRATRIAALRDHAAAAPLLVQLRAYEEAQLTFHRIHRQLAIQQLEMVGVDYGTGGTSFRDYLARYEQQAQPLFAGLSPR